MIVWFATGNKHKKQELEAVFGTVLGTVSGAGWELKIPADAGLDFDPAETGSTFYENSLLKARELRRILEKKRHQLYRPGDPVIADDSGLCVDALGGKPGIYSARYRGMGRCSGIGRDEGPPGAEDLRGGKKLDAMERNALLLEELGNNPRRSARFVCAMVLLLDEDRFFLAQETLEGELVQNIALAKGSGGFGYDPILYIPELRRTAAELSEEEKNRVSHRGKAGRAIARILEHFCQN